MKKVLANKILIIVLFITSFSIDLLAKKAAIVVDDNLIMFRKPTIYSKPTVVLKKGKLTRVIKCKNDWCKVKAGNYKGWLKKDSLWGLI